MQFLTVLPLPYSWGGGEKELGRSVPFFPFVGLVIGLLAALLDYALTHVLPILPASVLVVILMFAVSGGLHMDGLADTADGFMSSRPKERILEIMKDSRSGPMGVIAIVSVILLKVSLLASVVGPLRWGAILLTPIAGRCAQISVMAMLPYAKAEGGLGSIFMQHRSRLHLIWALLFVTLMGAVTFGYAGFIAGVASIAVTICFAWYTYRKIGGLTGDTLGAACEIVEIVPLLTAAVWLHLRMV